MKKKLLICGANGFIGKNLLQRFYNNSNYSIRAVYNKSEPDLNYNVEWIKADLRKEEDVKKVMQGVDVVLHYAATSTGAKDIVSKPYMHVTDNVVMSSLLFREALENDIEHFIFPSCTIMYQPSTAPVKEKDFNESDEVFSKYYGAGNTKVYLEKMCKFFSGFGKTKYTVLRQSNIYGPNDKFDLDKGHVFAATVTKAMTYNNKLTIWGTGEEERDLLYVSDLVNFVELALEKQEASYELFNVSAGKSISISSLVKNIVECSGRDLALEYDTSKPTIKTKLCVDNKRAKDVLGWEPKVSLVEGINKTLQWYKENNTITLLPWQIDFYDKNGYLIVPDIIPKEDREVFKAYMRRHANEDFASLMNPDRFESLFELDEREKTSKVTEECRESARIARNVMKNPTVVSIMYQLQKKRDFIALSSQYLFKEPGSKYANQAWSPHQDNYWPNNKNGAYFTFNWYLDRTDIENGCVYVYPGSHKEGLLPAEYVMSFREDTGEEGTTSPGPVTEVPEKYLDKKTDVILDKNCFVFFNGNLLHGTYANVTKDRPRPWYSCCYISKGEEYFVGEYSKRIEVEVL
jgi:GDP-L-fucose synthase